MKKLFISIVALCAVFNLSAQNKGEKYVGGNLGVATTSLIVDGESASAVKFAIDLWCLGRDNLYKDGRLGCSCSRQV